jgi:hypothetical protein
MFCVQKCTQVRKTVSWARAFSARSELLVDYIAQHCCQEYFEWNLRISVEMFEQILWWMWLWALFLVRALATL